MAPLRDSVAPFLRLRRSTLCLLLAAIVLLGLTESAQSAPWIRYTVRYQRVYTSKALLRFGPRYFPRPDSIQVYGLVRGDSEVILEYLLKEEGALNVEIEFAGGKKETHRFPKNGFHEKETRGVESFQLLTSLGEEPRVAIFTIWREDRSRGQDASFELRHLGIKNKPDAVAWMDSGTRLAMLAPSGLQSSSTIPLRFFISEITFSNYGDGARYSFILHANFHRLRVEVFNNSKRTLVQRLNTGCSPSQGSRCERIWDGLGKGRKKSTGRHIALVAVWTGAEWGVRTSAPIPIPKNL